MARSAAKKTAPERRAWSKQDFATLRKMAGKESLSTIAKALGRTEGATRQRATQNQISLRMKANKGGPGKKTASPKRAVGKATKVKTGNK